MSYILFISETKLKDSTAINLNVDVNLLLPYVRQAQKLYVEPKLGTQLTEKLKALITAGTLGLPINVNYKTLVDEYIGEIFSRVEGNNHEFLENLSTPLFRDPTEILTHL